MGIVPRMSFGEAEGTTYILLKSEAEQLGWRMNFHAG